MNTDVFLRYDFDGTYLPILEIEAPNGKDTFQHTTDVNIDQIDRLNLIIGASYYHDKDVNDGARVFFGGALGSLTFATLKARALAAYFDATYELADGLFFNVGGRYTTERKSISYRQTDPSQTINLVPPASARATFSDFIPRATIRYEIAANTNIFASISQGFRTGGFQPTPVADPSQVVPYRPEKITAYEIGFKTAQSAFASMSRPSTMTIPTFRLASPARTRSTTA